MAERRSVPEMHDTMVGAVTGFVRRPMHEVRSVPGADPGGTCVKAC